MEKDCKSTPQDTVDDGSTVVGGGFERFESSKSSKGYQPQQEGGRAGTSNPLASPGRDHREQPLEPFASPGCDQREQPLELDKLEERFRKECRKSCRRNLFVELLKTVAKVAGVILAAMGLSSFNEED